MDEKEAVLRLLNDESLKLSNEEIWKMMDDELAKRTEEVDGDLVRACIDALSASVKKGKDERSEMPKKRDLKEKTRRTDRWKIVLSIIAVLLFVASIVAICARKR